MTSQPATRPNPGLEVSKSIGAASRSVAAVLPSHIDPHMFVRVAQGIVRRDDNLAAAAHDNFPSFMSALMQCARLGLEPGETFHLVPFKDTKNGVIEVQGIVDYKGEIELIYRAGAVASVTAELVYSNDHFEYRPGLHDKPVHQVDWFSPRGELIGAYAYAEMTIGATSRVIVMGRTEINKIKAEAKGTDRDTSPWKKWPERMWLKTVVHQLYNWVPSSPEYLTELLKAKAAAAATGNPVAPAADTAAIPTHTTTGVTADDPDPIEDAVTVDPDTGEILDNPGATQ